MRVFPLDQYIERNVRRTVGRLGIVSWQGAKAELPGTSPATAGHSNLMHHLVHRTPHAVAILDLRIGIRLPRRAIGGPRPLHIHVPDHHGGELVERTDTRSHVQLDAAGVIAGERHTPRLVHHGHTGDVGYREPGLLERDREGPDVNARRRTGRPDVARPETVNAFRLGGHVEIGGVGTRGAPICMSGNARHEGSENENCDKDRKP